VAIVGSMIITIREIPRAEYPNYMMSNFIVSKESWWTATITWGLAYVMQTIVVIKKHLQGKSKVTKFPKLERLCCYCSVISSLSIIGLLVWDIESNPTLHRLFGALWGGPGTISTGLRVWFLDTAQNTWGNLARKVNFYGEVACSVPIALGMTVINSNNFFGVVIAIMEHVSFVHLRIFGNMFCYEELRTALKSKLNDDKNEKLIKNTSKLD
jgi:hypothetical protein